MSNETHVAVLLPTKGRPEQAVKRVSELIGPPKPKGVTLTVIAAVEKTDKETLDALKTIKGIGLQIVERKPGTTAVDGWNLAYNRAKELGAGWVVLGADDVEFKRGWLGKALDAAAGGAEVVGLNDGHTNMPHYGAHFMATVPFLERYIGGFISPPMYSSWWFDREVAEKANSLGKYAYTPQVVIEHHHPDWGLAEMDATYEEAWPSHDVDRSTYYRRRAQGDVESVAP